MKRAGEAGPAASGRCASRAVREARSIPSEPSPRAARPEGLSGRRQRGSCSSRRHCGRRDILVLLSSKPWRPHRVSRHGGRHCGAVESSLCTRVPPPDEPADPDLREDGRRRERVPEKAEEARPRFERKCLTVEMPGQKPPPGRLEEAELLRRVRDQEVLGLLVVLQHHLVRLAPDSGLLVAAEGGVCRVCLLYTSPSPRDS